MWGGEGGAEERGWGMHSDVMMSETVAENEHGGWTQAGMTCAAPASRRCAPL